MIYLLNLVIFHSYVKLPKASKGYIWLVVWNMNFIFHNIWDVIPNPLTWLIFFKMVIAPPTRWLTIINHHHNHDYINHIWATNRSYIYITIYNHDYINLGFSQSLIYIYILTVYYQPMVGYCTTNGMIMCRICFHRYTACPPCAVPGKASTLADDGIYEGPTRCLSFS